MLEVMSGMDRATLERLKPPPPTDAHQAVTVRGYISEEGTLSDVTALALESLGGTLTHPMSDERRHRASTRLTPAGLAARHRHNNRAWLRALAAAPFQLARALVRSAIGRLRRLF